MIKLGYDNGIIYLKFKTNVNIIIILKEFGDVQFSWKKKYWKINLATLDETIKQLEIKGYIIEKEESFIKVFG